MPILRLVTQGIYFIPQSVKALKFMATSFPDFISRGGISIETPFQNRYTDEKYVFRTVVQLDADIIDLLPDPKLSENEKVYMENYQTHLHKVRKAFTEFEGISTITWAISIALSAFSLILIPEICVYSQSCNSASSAFSIILPPENIALYGYDAGNLTFIFLIIFTYIFQKIRLSRYLFKQIISLFSVLIIKKIIKSNSD